jgi:TetR/AcrR family transcriptional repressor of nem operon
MTRYGKEHKQATRRRIIEAAGRRLKRDGIDGSGVAALMADAGLTNGAFYAHFDSKEDLVANVLVEQLREQRESFSAMSVEQVVRTYLSTEHRNHPEAGCPSAALLDEIVRSPESTKRAYTEGLLGLVDAIAERLAPLDPGSARVQALTVFSLLVGTLEVSRALADRHLADEILEQGIKTALGLLGVDPS